MRFIIKVIQLEDFRNIKSGETLWLENITSLVGPNESGKTSLLEAISQLSEFNLSVKDATKGTEKSNSGGTPRIKFFLGQDDELRNNLQGEILNLTEKSLLYIVVNSADKDQWEIKLSTYNPALKAFQGRDIKSVRLYKNTSGSELEITIGNEVQKIPPDGEIKLLGKNPKNASLVRLKKLTEISKEELIKRMKSEIISKLPKIIWWPPRELSSQGIQKVYDQFYIGDSVPWIEFMTDPNKYPSIKRLFDIASLESNVYLNWHPVLKGYNDRKDDRQINDYLNKQADVITKVIVKRWNQSTISIDLSLGTDGSLILSIYENKKRIEPSTRSEGFKWFLSFLLYFFTNREELKNIIVLMDQPGEYLHPGGQKELRKRLEEITLDSNQIIYATQSPFLVDRNEWKKTQFLKKTEDGTVVATPTEIDVVNDTLLRESLGYTLVDVGQANELNVVVEGYTDRWILQTTARIIKNKDINKIGTTKVEFDLNKLAVIEAVGIFGKENVFSKVQVLRNGQLKTIGVYDSDTDGRNALRKSKQDPSLGKYFYSLVGLLPNSKAENGEDLIPKSIYAKSLKNMDRALSDKEIEKLSERPRVPQLRSKFGQSFSRKKEELWSNVGNIIGQLLGDENNIRVILKEKEIEMALRFLNKVYKILDSDK